MNDPFMGVTGARACLLLRMAVGPCAVRRYLGTAGDARANHVGLRARFCVVCAIQLDAARKAIDGRRRKYEEK
jgi:hypothetical protein